MTTTESRPTAAASEALVREFFDAYRRQDVGAMTDLCADNADFSYIPYEVWGKQRVLRGDGKVKTVGKTIWTGLINSFPDLTNVVHSVDANEAGDVVVTCDIGGTQQLAWGFAEPRGKVYSEPHLFVFHVDDAGEIDRISAYWDGASTNRQLGHLEVD
ncbi:nuclear transport factor 2 family protein [Amycolatopsis sp. MEPSY49]|uniref:nuclear transport factor 2 family protein n=1 Tax=Amycolatopsis sp. MEPSY49 TaxID=3151600 RepID=UPI003EF294B1